MRRFLLLLPFLALTAFFFLYNTGLDRGEYGAFDYTLTKSLPVLALSAIAFVAFRPPVRPVSCGLTLVDQIVNLRHPAALAFLFSAIGDWLLANRSNSVQDFALGIFPFAAAHYWNTKFCSSNLAFGQRYWWPAVVYVIVHAGVVGLATSSNVLRRTHFLFQIVTLPYAFLLGWTVWCAISNWYYDPHRNSSRATLLYMLGYITFMFSDSILMFDEFGSPIARAQVYILTTYYAAQGLIFLSFEIHDSKAKGR